MDSFTKKLVDKASAYSVAFSEVFEQDTTINDTEVDYIEDQDVNGTFVRAYHESVGYSSKYYYA